MTVILQHTEGVVSDENKKTCCNTLKTKETKNFTYDIYPSLDVPQSVQRLNTYDMEISFKSHYEKKIIHEKLPRGYPMNKKGFSRNTPSEIQMLGLLISLTVILR